MRKDHFALYGNVKLIRAHCIACDSVALVVDGMFACCDKPFDGVPTEVKRMVSPEARRKGPSKKSRKDKLAEQEDRCFYCSRTFGSFALVNGELKKLRVAWDHMLPFAYNANNTDSNFAAACHVCNAWKSDHIFTTLEEAQTYLLERWRTQGH